jgi:hypothetical protein
MRRLGVMVVIAVALVIASLGWTQSSITRLAFDNSGYPNNVHVHFWLDDGTEQTLDASCALDGCQTEPVSIAKGRHRIRLQVIVDGRTSPITETTVER